MINCQITNVMRRPSSPSERQPTGDVHIESSPVEREVEDTSARDIMEEIIAQVEKDYPPEAFEKNMNDFTSELHEEEPKLKSVNSDAVKQIVQEQGKNEKLLNLLKQNLPPFSDSKDWKDFLRLSQDKAVFTINEAIYLQSYIAGGALAFFGDGVSGIIGTHLMKWGHKNSHLLKLRSAHAKDEKNLTEEDESLYIPYY